MGILFDAVFFVGFFVLSLGFSFGIGIEKIFSFFCLVDLKIRYIRW